jgi:protein-S-isoprenylcysteine O-methyltransferase Ste14
VLSERERRDLAEIEQRLCGDDPALERAFRRRAFRRRAVPRRAVRRRAVPRRAVRRWPYYAMIVLLVLMAVGFVLLGDISAASSTLTFAAVTVAVGWWQLWRRGSPGARQ